MDLAPVLTDLGSDRLPLVGSDHAVLVIEHAEVIALDLAENLEQLRLESGLAAPGQGLDGVTLDGTHFVFPFLGQSVSLLLSSLCAFRGSRSSLPILLK